MNQRRRSRLIPDLVLDFFAGRLKGEEVALVDQAIRNGGQAGEVAELAQAISDFGTPIEVGLPERRDASGASRGGSRRPATPHRDRSPGGRKVSHVKWRARRQAIRKRAEEGETSGRAPRRSSQP